MPCFLRKEKQGYVFVVFSVLFILMGYPRKNPNRGGEVEDMKFPGVMKRVCGNYWGQLKRKCNFQRCYC